MIVLIILAVLALLYILFWGTAALIIGGAFRPAIGTERMERIFVEDYELLVIVRDYFKNSEHETIFLHKTTESEARSLQGNRIELEGIEAVEAISALWGRGYSAIGKRGNVIHFQRWANRHNGRGIAYSIDGSEPTDADLQFLTRAEPLSVPGWYYYEENVREWRFRNEE